MCLKLGQVDSSQEITCCGDSYILNSFSMASAQERIKKKVVTGDTLELADSHEH